MRETRETLADRNSGGNQCSMTNGTITARNDATAEAAAATVVQSMYFALRSLALAVRDAVSRVSSSIFNLNTSSCEVADTSTLGGQAT